MDCSAIFSRIERFPITQALKIAPVIENFTEQEAHKEPCAKLDFDMKFYVTDVANVAGNSVESDGGYLAYEGKLYNIADIK